jgi:hypothetical protein
VKRFSHPDGEEDHDQDEGDAHEGDFPPRRSRAAAAIEKGVVVIARGIRLGEKIDRVVADQVVDQGVCRRGQVEEEGDANVGDSLDIEGAHDVVNVAGGQLLD